MSQKTTKQQQQRRRRNRGMTLIEIMVVITILGLIAAAVGVAVIPKLDEAKQDTARLDIGNIQNALKLYYTKKGKYPDTATGLRALVETQNLERIPTDPWGNEYVYMNEGGKPVIISYGADGVAGGDGSDADISSRDTAGATGKR
jgi:general secretion pathway protein G